jgi:hypothetical protein
VGLLPYLVVVAPMRSFAKAKVTAQLRALCDLHVQQGHQGKQAVQLWGPHAMD